MSVSGFIEVKDMCPSSSILIIYVDFGLTTGVKYLKAKRYALGHFLNSGRNSGSTIFRGWFFSIFQVQTLA